MFVNRNPYRTPEPHPVLQTAFDLGMIGLEKLKEKPDLLDGGYRHYRRCPVKEHLSEFCRCVFCLLCGLHSVCWGGYGYVLEFRAVNDVKWNWTPSYIDHMPLAYMYISNLTSWSRPVRLITATDVSSSSGLFKSIVVQEWVIMNYFWRHISNRKDRVWLKTKEKT